MKDALAIEPTDREITCMNHEGKWHAHCQRMQCTGTGTGTQTQAGRSATSPLAEHAHTHSSTKHTHSPAITIIPASAEPRHPVTAEAVHRHARADLRERNEPKRARKRKHSCTHMMSGCTQKPGLHAKARHPGTADAAHRQPRERACGIKPHSRSTRTSPRNLAASRGKAAERQR